MIESSIYELLANSMVFGFFAIVTTYLACSGYKKALEKRYKEQILMKQVLRVDKQHWKH